MASMYLPLTSVPGHAPRERRHSRAARLSSLISSRIRLRYALPLLLLFSVLFIWNFMIGTNTRIAFLKNYGPHRLYCSALIKKTRIILPPPSPPPPSISNHSVPRAKPLEPSALLASSRTENIHSITHLIHQSWKSKTVPSYMAVLSDTFKIDYSEWEYVLWTDADNLNFVKDKYPQFLDTYRSLPREIYRADMVRPLYMHAFGGIYADLDTDSIKPLMEAFAAHRPSESRPVAFVAQMGPDEDLDWFEDSIPNAFMASTPGHPFWLEYAQRIVDRAKSHGGLQLKPEKLTGPGMLREGVRAWDNSKHDEDVIVLPPDMIYGHSWMHADELSACICSMAAATFDRLLCRAIHPTAWALAYWKHSWGNNVLAIFN